MEGAWNIDYSPEALLLFRKEACFLSTETGFGMAGLKGGLPFLEISNGEIHIVQCWVSGEMAEIKLQMSKGMKGNS